MDKIHKLIQKIDISLYTVVSLKLYYYDMDDKTRLEFINSWMDSIRNDLDAFEKEIKDGLE